MNQTQVTVPQGLVESWRFFDRNHVAIIGVLAVALLATATTEIVKRKYNAKQLKAAEAEAVTLSKKATAWTLAASTSVFTALGYILFLAQQNQSLISQVPYIGQGITEAIGVGYLLYNLRLNKTYEKVAGWAGKWSSGKPASSESLPQPQIQVTSPDSFEG